MRPPPRDEAETDKVCPERSVKWRTAVLGWASRSSTVRIDTSIPASLAIRKLWGRLGSSGAISSRPATMARSVPWPAPVDAKDPWSKISAWAGWLPSRCRATRPIRAAPAVWELDGPTITGPIMSKMFKETPHFPKRRDGRGRPARFGKGQTLAALLHYLRLDQVGGTALADGDAGGDNHRVAGFDNAFLSG